MSATNHDQVFVLRFWQERGDPQPPTGWRARISDVNSGKQYYTSRIDDAFDLVKSLLRAVDPDEGQSP
jgi:hypothetical protein